VSEVQIPTADIVTATNSTADRAAEQPKLRIAPKATPSRARYDRKLSSFPETRNSPVTNDRPACRRIGIGIILVPP
jgi:hypothetical protein